MPNKQITDLDPLVGGMDDTYNFWTQVDGGGPGSSYAVAWSQLLLAKSAAAASAGNGVSLVTRGGNGDGALSIGGGNYHYAGDGGASGGGFRGQGGDASAGYGGTGILQGGDGSVGGGDIILQGGNADTYAGNIKLRPGIGLGYDGYLLLDTGSGRWIKWDSPTTAAAAQSGGLYVEAGTNALKRKP